MKHIFLSSFIIPLLSFVGAENGIVSIVGEWGIYHTVYTQNGKSVASSCNVCPRVNFKNNNTADLTNGIGNVSEIGWEQIADTLIIRNGKNKQSIINDGKYLIRPTKTKENFIEIELVMLNEGVMQVLRKSK